jgi:pyroglutamyl-peptidase
MLLWLLLLSLLPPCAHAEGRARVLVTVFEPFLDLKENGSEKVGQELLRVFGRGRSPVEYELCVLPVVYDEAARVAQDCYAKAATRGKIDLVVATGETNGCYVRLETRAHNNDQFAGPDNRGVVRRRPRPIVPAGASQEYFTFPGEAMYCALATVPSPSRVSARLSTSPGNFLCNHVAYHLNRVLRDEGVPFGFVHLPEAACPARKIRSAAAALHRMVLAALDRPPAEGEWPTDEHVCHATYRRVVDTAPATQGLPK